MTLEETLRTLIREIIREELPVRPRVAQPLLTAEEAGQRLGVDKQTVYRLKREEALKAVYLSETRFMFQVEEIERFIGEGGVKLCRLAEAPRRVARGGQP